MVRVTPLVRVVGTQQKTARPMANSCGLGTYGQAGMGPLAGALGSIGPDAALLPEGQGGRKEPKARGDEQDGRDAQEEGPVLAQGATDVRGLQG